MAAELAQWEAAATSSASTRKRRIEWIDIAKGLGIILVSFGHLRNGDGQSVWLPALDGTIAGIYLFHMPLFFLLAGLTFSDRRPLGEFALRKARTLLVPYAVFSLYFLAKPVAVALVPGLAGAFQTGHDYGIARASFDVIVMGNGLWFLMALFLAELACWALSRALRAVGPRAAVMGLLGLAVIAIYFSTYSAGPSLALPFKLDRAFEALGFMCVGIAAKDALLGAARSGALLVAIAAAAAFALVAIPLVASAQMGLGVQAACRAAAALSGTLAVALLSIAVARSGLLSYLGRESLMFYAVNALSMNVAKLMLFRVAGLDLAAAPFAIQAGGGALCTLLGMLVMWVLCLVVHRWIPWAIGQRGDASSRLSGSR